jgi:hypothetical protein
MIPSSRHGIERVSGNTGELLKGKMGSNGRHVRIATASDNNMFNRKTNFVI